MSISMNIDNRPEIKSNLESNLDLLIKKYAGMSHGLSLIAISLLDPAHKSITIEMKYNDQHTLSNAVDYIIAIWNAYEPILTKLRTYKIDGKLLDHCGDLSFSLDDAYPHSTDAFGHYKVLVDITNTENKTYIFNLYRWGEPGPRVLKLYTMDE